MKTCGLGDKRNRSEVVPMADTLAFHADSSFSLLTQERLARAMDHRYVNSQDRKVRLGAELL